MFAVWYNKEVVKIKGRVNHLRNLLQIIAGSRTSYRDQDRFIEMKEGDTVPAYDVELDNFRHRTASYWKDIQAGKKNPAYTQNEEK
jgi:hypothetical protein